MTASIPYSPESMDCQRETEMAALKLLDEALLTLRIIASQKNWTK